MEKLTNLYKLKKALLPELRSNTERAARNLNDGEQQNQLRSIEHQYNEILQALDIEKARVIKEKFGQETFNEWALYEQIKDKPHMTGSELEKQIAMLREKIIEVLVLLYEAENGFPLPLRDYEVFLR